MKRLALISLLGIFIAACSTKSKEAKISGIIENSPAEKIEVYYFKDFITNEREMVALDLDESGSFSGSMALTEGQFAYVKIGRIELPLYLMPGSDINLSFDAEYPDVLPVIEGKKTLESMFLFTYQNDIEPANSRSFFINSIREKTPEEFFVAVENSLSEKLGYLFDHENFEKLDKDFKSKLENIFTYEKYELLMLYPRVWASNNPEGELELPEEYFDFLTEEGLFNDQAARSRPYFSFATEYLTKCIADNQVETDNMQVSFENNFKFSTDFFSGQTRDAMLTKSFLDLLRYGNFEKAKEFYETYNQKVTSIFYRDFVAAEYKKIAAVAPGQPAPDFTLVDIDGNDVSMSDFLGKVVYLDFWASWCGPCMRQMPHMKELKKRMEGKDLVFLYISVDEDEDAWRKTVAEKEIEGIHLNVAGRKQPVTVAYAVRGIPKFYLIGRDGTIIDNVPPRPSNPDVDQAILKALEL